MDDGYERGRLRFRPRATTGEHEPGLDEPLGLGDDADGGGRGRDGVIYVPDTAEPGAPLLVFLHGATGTGRAHLRAVLAAADRYGVVVLAPDSRGATTWDLIEQRRLGPDPAFLDRALEAVVDRVDADVEGRLALGGVSDGASYALTLGLVNGDVFGTVIAFSPGFLAVPGTVGRPRVYVSHGTADPVLPIDACSRSLVPPLRDEGYEVRYTEFDGGHTVPPPIADEALDWWLT
jgi:phospholipase/carboxylesterase